MRGAARKAVAVALGVAIGGAVVVAGGAAWAWRELSSPWRGYGGDGVTVVVEPGTSARAILDTLARHGVVEHPRLVLAWLSLRDRASALHAGEYRFERPMTPLEVVEKLERGDVVLHAVTIPEGLALAEVASAIAERGLSTRDALSGVFGDPSPVARFDPEAIDLEGYLFPDTYFFPRTVTPEVIARTMVDRFVEVIGGVEAYAARVGAHGLDLRDAVTLASMIEEETGVEGERARVARVFLNRLDRGMRMQCDPTVIYAIRRDGGDVETLTRRDLEYPSPWNTYRVHGLPPGPIASPGAASLQAVAAPAEGDELYFVAAPGGGHRFSETLDAHLRAVREWRRYLRSSR